MSLVDLFELSMRTEMPMSRSPRLLYPDHIFALALGNSKWEKNSATTTISSPGAEDDTVAPRVIHSSQRFKTKISKCDMNEKATWGETAVNVASDRRPGSRAE